MNYSEWEKIHDYCMEKPCVYETRPFGEYPICYRVSGKIFAQLSPNEDWYKVTLKTNPDAADFYRRAYPGVVVRGYHCPPVQQPYWNTIELNEMPYETVCQMIDEAYDEVVMHLTKKEQGKLPRRAKFVFKKTDTNNADFVKLCREPDNAAAVILVYDDDQNVIGCGAYSLYDEDTVEIKRIYIDEEYRRLGLGKEVVLRLEADARIKDFRYGIVVTGELPENLTALYKKIGYKQIDVYGQCTDMPESLRMRKKL